MKKILIKNIKGLVQVGESLPKIVRGKEMAHVPIIENAFLALEDGMVVAYGSMEDWGGISDWRDLEIIDADGNMCFQHFAIHILILFSQKAEKKNLWTEFMGFPMKKLHSKEEEY
jgi:imidazolonepropionase